MKKQIKKGLKWSLFLLSSAVFASPLAIPHNSSKLYPTVTQGNIGAGSVNGKLQDIVLVYENIPNAYHTSPINLRAYLSYFYNYGDYNPKLVVYIAGGQGGWHQLPGTAATVVGGTGGITIFTAPLLNFIKQFGNNVSFYYVVGGKGGTSGNSAGGGGASMVAVNNWPHDGGTTLAIAGGGGGSTINLAGWGSNQTSTMYGGGGGGGNDCGENGIPANPLYAWGAPTIFGQGGCQGKGGNSGNAQGGSANPKLIDIAGGGGGAMWGGINGLWCSGAGGGTGSPGQSCNGSPGSGTNGYGYQNGGDGFLIYTGFGTNNDYSGGSPDGGYGGGGGSSTGSDSGGGGGYGGGGAGWVGGGGGGGGYCLDANHSPANNPSLGAELGSSCQAIDWDNPYDGVYGNYGNGYAYIYIEP